MGPSKEACPSHSRMVNASGRSLATGAVASQKIAQTREGDGPQRCALCTATRRATASGRGVGLSTPETAANKAEHGRRE